MTSSAQKRQRSVSSIAGVFAIIAFTTLAVVAFLHYPSSFSPRHNWLSDLSNIRLNPRGAVFYRLGAIVSGAALIVFFGGFSDWSRHLHITAAPYLILTRRLGSYGAVAFIMTGVFSEDRLLPHTICSVTMFICMGAAVTLSGVAMLHSPRIPKAVSYLAFTIALAEITYGVFHWARWMEWIVVALLIVYIAAVSRVSRRMKCATAQEKNAKAKTRDPHPIAS